MIRADQIPPDAMYAAWKAMNAGMTLNDAIAAALSAWPGKERDDGHLLHTKYCLILPLPQEVK